VLDNLGKNGTISYMGLHLNCSPLPVKEVKMENKTCKKCNQTKPIERFQGERSVCRDCRNLAQKKYRQRNKDHIRQKNLEYQRAHKENKKVYSERWYLKHIDEIKIKSKKNWRAFKEIRTQEQINKKRDYMLKWREDNAEWIIEYNKKNHRKYYLNNKKKITEKSKLWVKTEKGKIASRARALRRSHFLTGNYNNFTLSQWEEIKQRQNFRCAHCGEIKPLTKDHIIPLSKGGSHTADNIQGLCQRCNSSKLNKIESIAMEKILKGKCLIKEGLI
jgi:5-methylcytosine-specific restriction endonuclease McrA